MKTLIWKIKIVQKSFWNTIGTLERKGDFFQEISVKMKITQKMILHLLYTHNNNECTATTKDLWVSGTHRK